MLHFNSVDQLACGGAPCDVNDMVGEPLLIGAALTQAYEDGHLDGAAAARNDQSIEVALAFEAGQQDMEDKLLAVPRYRFF